jgi:hypothetical protein
MLCQPTTVENPDSGSATAAAAQLPQDLALTGLQQDGSLALVREVCQGLQQSIAARLGDLSGGSHPAGAMTGHLLVPEPPQQHHLQQQQPQQRSSSGAAGSEASNATSLHIVNCGPNATPAEQTPPGGALLNAFPPALQPQLYAQPQYGMYPALPPGMLGYAHMLQGAGFAGMGAWAQGAAQLQLPGWPPQPPCLPGSAWQGAVPTPGMQSSTPAEAAPAGVGAVLQPGVSAGLAANRSWEVAVPTTVPAAAEAGTVPQPPLPAGQHPNDVSRCPPGATDSSTAAAGLSQEIQDVVQRCKKEVAGSLDDLAGLR